MLILGIESSCDETAAAVVEINQKNGKSKTLSNIISSQIEIHQKYGGVIPEIAAREHVLNVLPVIHEALEKAGINHKKIEAIAVTKGPGLITSLITGLETARTLAYVWNKPLIGVNHIAGHIYSDFLELKQKIIFPLVVLTVSGGHTNLVLMKDYNTFKIVGETRDDAAGEAYDKGAKMLELGYPGGPIISKYAKIFSETGQVSKIILPRPLIGNGLDFSFSGLKTSLLYQLQKDKDWKNRVAEYCFAYQEAIIDVLSRKTMAAAKKYGAKTIMLSGGVSANTELRLYLAKKVSQELPQNPLIVPQLAYTTDNAAMIALAGYYALQSQPKTSWQKLKVDVNFGL
ncbi:MAG: tRNA (adenosine(37)-N6)-threonylcarbamoyltransferase complex transferase subunit TsaD [Candidatus Falkowbacteria bacterium]